MYIINAAMRLRIRFAHARSRAGENTTIYIFIRIVF